MMVEIHVRPATPEDAPFLAVAMQEADRGHTGIGSWDVMFPGAELDGEPAGTVAGYAPEHEPPERFATACREALGSACETALARGGAWSREFFTIAIPGDTLRVEWVYTDPRWRGRGVSSILIGRLLDDARAAGRSSAHVGTYIDNHPALSTYRRFGFEQFPEARHVDYERTFRAPGLVFLRRSL